MHYISCTYPHNAYIALVDLVDPHLKLVLNQYLPPVTCPSSVQGYTKFGQSWPFKLDVTMVSVGAAMLLIESPVTAKLGVAVLIGLAALLFVPNRHYYAPFNLIQVMVHVLGVCAHVYSASHAC